MKNLLKETEKVLDAYDKTWNDVKGICLGYRNKYWDDPTMVRITIDNFIKIADKTYDEGYGGQEVNPYIKIVGDSWWMERFEYDGAEWWEFKTLPNIKGYELVENAPDWYIFHKLKEKEDDYYD